MISKKQALEYHSRGRAGKIEVVATKSTLTQRDLSLAYTPGVAEPCREILQDPAKVTAYTARGNLVGVVTNGTAVLGLGNIGPLAGKPVMEGKGVLFKRFADIDVFDIEINTEDVDEFVQAVKLLEPTFGGINLEDIKAPGCFEIERRLIEAMNIPVFHDDQHGTAIISAAALLNAVELAGKKMETLRVVVAGAGAAAIACARHYMRFGIQKENIIMCDSQGPIYVGREAGMNPYKAEFAVETKARTLAEAMKGTDVFLGLSQGGIVSQEMVRFMAEKPIVFALANPDPEITYPEAKAARKDIIMATGRSDYPNQVNNVLGFPFIFRGALDVQAQQINTEMKVAASRALAELAREDVPDEVAKVYGKAYLHFGPDYIIPKPFDSRVLTWEATAVAQAAIDTGVANRPVDMSTYGDVLVARLGKSRELMQEIYHKAQRDPKRIVFPEGESESIIRASHQMVVQGIARPILLGDPQVINQEAERLQVDLTGVELMDPKQSDRINDYVQALYELRQRKGVTRRHARNMMKRPNYFASMMVYLGEADGLVSGITKSYPETLRPALQIIPLREGVKHVAGMYLLVFKNKIKFLADVTVNIDPDAETLAEIATLAAEAARKFGVTPRVAIVSFSNFGTVKHPLALKAKRAVELIKASHPDFEVDGEMHADVAVSTEMLKEHFPFSTLKSEANVLIFPELTAGNVTYKLFSQLGNATAIGPILMGLSKPVNLLQFASSTVEDIVNMTAITVLDVQYNEK